MDEIRPNTAEVAFLNLAYERFYKIYDEVMDDSFWQRSEQYRFSRTKDGFAIYAELLNYEPVKWVIENLKRIRPPMEAEIGGELFKFVRNVIAHFSFYDSWDDTWINKAIVNWNKEGQTIDKFLREYEGREGVKYRFWEAKKKRMTYLSINFPDNYTGDQKVFLKEILSEKEGVKFSFILMKRIIDTQIEKE